MVFHSASPVKTHDAGMVRLGVLRYLAFGAGNQAAGWLPSTLASVIHWHFPTLYSLSLQVYVDISRVRPCAPPPRMITSLLTVSAFRWFVDPGGRL